MREMIYIGDAMCSWCWGFAPVITELKEEYADSLQFSLLLGGLRPGELAETMNEKTKKVIEHHWRQVARASGQPFRFDFFRLNDFVYDTEPAARAVMAMRQEQPENDFSFFKDLQRAFYAENRDVTSQAVLNEVAAYYGVSAPGFAELCQSDGIRKKTYREFYLVSQLGVAGFPAVLLKEGEQMMYLTRGYQPHETLAPHVAEFSQNGFSGISTS